jgi:hypothetical protein
MFCSSYQDERPSAADAPSPAPVTKASDGCIPAWVDVHDVRAGIETSLDGVGLLAAVLLSARVGVGTFSRTSVSRFAGC